MNETSEDLWDSYLLDFRGEWSSEYRWLTERLAEKEDALLEAFDLFQSDAFCSREKDAFVRGVRFAVRFLLEGMSGV